MSKVESQPGDEPSDDAEPFEQLAEDFEGTEFGELCDRLAECYRESTNS